MPDTRWTLWVFAGPGALSGPTITSEGSVLPNIPLGAGLPLDKLLAGKLPAGVELVAETIGDPTLVQQLTGEWPAQRWSGTQLATAPAERDLAAFLAWANTQTKPGSRRALIVLGDLLRACGEAPEAMPAGGYRPTYPTPIKVKKGSLTDTYTKNADNTYAKAGASGSYTVVQIGATLSAGDSANFDNASTWYVRQSATGNTYSLVDASGNPVLDKDKRPMANATIDWTASGVALVDPASRALDANGPIDADPSSRRIDLLAGALERQRVDLLVSDATELVRVAALRRLAPRVSVMVGARCSNAWAGHVLLASLDALAGAPEAETEPLALALLDAYAKRLAALQAASTKAGGLVEAALRHALAGGHELVALRSHGAAALVEGLDQLAQQVLATPLDSPESRCVGEACRVGGDISGLLAGLENVAKDRRRTLAATLGTATLARRVLAATAASDRSCGIELDGLGLALGPASDWTRLLDRVSGRRDADLVRRTIAEVRALAARPVPLTGSASPLLWLEYRPKPKPDFDAATDFAAFLAAKLAEPATRGARHLALVVRGARTSGASIAVTGTAALSFVQLARLLREALAQQLRSPLALLVVEDPELMAVELAYELRDVAYTFASATRTPKGTSAPPSQALLEARVSAKLVRRCEQQSADTLGTASSSIASLLDPWRRGVACRLAQQLVAPDQDLDGTLDANDKDDDDDGVLDSKDTDDDDDGILDTKELVGELALQIIDLRHIESLCRRFGRLCRRMFESLGDPAVLDAAKLAASAGSLIELINRAQMGALAKGGPDANDINLALGDVYNWISGRADAIVQGGSPFWIDPSFVEDRSPAGYATRLRITTAAGQASDYASLSFHRDVWLHALLTAARLLEPPTQKLWGFVSLGLVQASARERRDALERFGVEPEAANYFESLATAPLLSLDVEPRDHEYELSLSSSLSAAVLVRRRNTVDPAALEGLAHVLSRGAASRAGWTYVESLGASLAEDLLHGLDEALERERLTLLASGRCRDPHLALSLPREWMSLPWEILRVPARSPGQADELLASRFALGRQMWSDREIRRVRRDDRIRVLIVADPRTSAAALPGARAEGEAIRELCRSMTQQLGHGFAFECDASIGETLTVTALRRLMREGRYDVLHFAGHGTHRADAPEASGWLLSDGLLSVTQLRNTLEWTETPPWLIFANACSAGMVEATSDQQDVHGMAEACIRAGVNAFVAPLWKVHDESARMLACEFHRRLLLERASVGVALQQARNFVCKTWETLRGDTGLGDVSWAGMVLFGNPTERLNESAS